MMNEDGIAAPAVDQTYGQDALLREGHKPEEGHYTDTADAEREIALQRQFQDTGDWFTACQQLGLAHDNITREQLIRATLSRDLRVQVARLDSLFRACGLKDPNLKVERTDLVAVIADQAPRDERERQILYQAAVARNLAMFCAEGASRSGNTPQVTALLAGSFQKLSNHSLTLDEKLNEMRFGSGSTPHSVIGHVHVHTTAAGSSREFFLGDGSAPDTLSIGREPGGAVDFASQANAARNEGRGAAEVLGAGGGVP